MSTAFSAIIDDVVRMPGLGLKLVVSTSSSAATATTVSPRLARVNPRSKDHNGKYLWIPSAAAADDQVRSIDYYEWSGTTTTINFHDTSNFAESLSSVAAYILPSHPDVYMAATNEGLEKTHVRVEVPLMHGGSDMQGGSVDAYWTEANATDTVQTTASEVLRGAQSLVVLDSGSGGGYTASGSYRVGQGKGIILHMEAKADTGTGELQVIDGSSNEQDDITFTEEQWIAARKRVDFDAADELFTLRLVSVGASDSIDWQRVWFVRKGEYNFILPSWITNDYVVRGLFRRRYLTPANDSGSTDELWLAESNDDDLLYEDHDYKAYKRSADANPHRVTLLKPAHDIEDPLIMLVDCPWSAPYGVSTVYTSYTSTTQCPKTLAVALTLKYLGINNGWDEIAEMGDERYDKAYVMNEMSEQTKPDPEPWAGPMGGLII